MIFSNHHKKVQDCKNNNPTYANVMILGTTLGSSADERVF